MMPPGAYAASVDVGGAVAPPAIGGVGKTHLAQEHAHRHAVDYEAPLRDLADEAYEQLLAITEALR